MSYTQICENWVHIVWNNEKVNSQIDNVYH